MLTNIDQGKVLVCIGEMIFSVNLMASKSLPQDVNKGPLATLFIK